MFVQHKQKFYLGVLGVANLEVTDLGRNPMCSEGVGKKETEFIKTEKREAFKSIT